MAGHATKSPLRLSAKENGGGRSGFAGRPEHDHNSARKLCFRAEHVYLFEY